MIQCHPAPPEGACEPNAATLRHANASHYDADSFSTLLSQKAEPTAAALKQLNAAHYEADSFSMLLSTREACSGCCAGSGADTFSPAPGQSAHASLVSDARAGLRSKPPKLGTIFDEHGRSHEDHRQSGGPKPLQGGHRRCTGRRRTGHCVYPGARPEESVPRMLLHSTTCTFKTTKVKWRVILLL